MKDEQIKKNVIDELYWDSRIDASDIKAEVNDGRVLLQGTVPTYSSKIIASKDVWNVPNIKWVTNNLDVEHGVKVPTDEDIVRNINDRYTWNQLLHPEKFEIMSSEGQVTLTGTVDAYWKKELAESEAQSVLGVKDIVNNIAIVPSHKYTDMEIAKKVVGALSRRPFINPEDIDIRVEDKVVTLNGEVSNWMAYHAATSAAHYTSGVKDVDNQLRVS